MFFGFCICYGLAFTVGTEWFEGAGDGVRYRVLFEQYRNVPWSFYLKDLRDYLQFDEGAKDFYADTISFLVSRITSNYHVLFMVYAIIFSYFQLKCLRFFVTNNKTNRLTLYVFCLLLLFLSNHIFNINGVRFWTAAWIALYSVLQVFYNGNKKYLLLALFTPFVHGSYFLFLFFMFLCLITKKYKKAWFIIYILSFAFSTIAVDVFNFALDYLPSFMAKQASAYLDEWNIEARNARVGTGFWAIAKFLGSVEKVYINILLILLVINRNLIDEKHSDDLLSFLVVLCAMCNFAMPIPSVGVRFIRLTFPIIALLYMKKMPEKRFTGLLMLFPVIFVFDFYYMFLHYMSSVGIKFFISSPLYLLYNL